MFDDENIGEMQKYYNNFPESQKIQIPFYILKVVTLSQNYGLMVIMLV